MSTLRKTKEPPPPTAASTCTLTIGLSFCWCSVEMARPLIWPDYMKHEVYFWLMFYATALSLTDYAVGPLRHRKGVRWWRRGERHAWGRAETEVRGWERDVVWRKSIFYRLPAWLAGYSSGTASHFLSNCSTCSISRQQKRWQKEGKKKKKQKTEQTAQQETPDSKGQKTHTVRGS